MAEVNDVDTDERKDESKEWMIQVTFTPVDSYDSVLLQIVTGNPRTVPEHLDFQECQIVVFDIRKV